MYLIEITGKRKMEGRQRGKEKYKQRDRKIKRNGAREKKKWKVNLIKGLEEWEYHSEGVREDDGGCPLYSVSSPQFWRHMLRDTKQPTLSWASHSIFTHTLWHTHSPTYRYACPQTRRNTCLDTRSTLSLCAWAHNYLYTKTLHSSSKKSTRSLTSHDWSMLHLLSRNA